MPRDDISFDITTPIRVLVVDDQRFMRIALRQIIEHDGDMRVVGEARTGVEAVAMARELKPDAVTMDIEMPEMDGLEACASIMREVTPKPAIIMVSAHTQAGAQGAIDALQRGAVDFVSKASVVAKTDLAKIDTELRPKLRAWSKRRGPAAAGAVAAAADDRAAGHPIDIVAIVASTGGPQALTALFKAMGPITPPIVVALHMPEFFTSSLAAMLSQDTGCSVHEGSHGMALAASAVVIIPGGRDGVIARRRGGAGHELRLVKVKASVHPCGDALLESAAMMAQAPVGIVLTGMGEDGARGAAALRRRKAEVLVQEPSSCVVDGMPNAAIAAAPGAKVLGLDDMAAKLAGWSARHAVSGGAP
jgi:two-component system, chemotaxis family, protein-glutamate methylesterase/glutaminase